MQVAHVQDHVTHAVIGPNTAVSFGISDSPEFFNILSNTLYSDKPLAVIRETLCNAWDAHIAAGRTDKPVKITLTRQELVIRDYGTGIKKEQMHAVYCVYGASTKVHDGNQTGGFGLGCKAPFAYVDHFEVTNFNAGKKTIYRISKSSGEVGGKPGLLEILSIPSDETGIEVRIELKSPNDSPVFGQIIRRIAAAGEMCVSLNDELLPVLPFSQAKQGYLLTNSNLASSSGRKIFVRYGNVVYPVEVYDGFREEYRSAEEVLGAMPGRDYYGDNSWKLILQAQPNTISITPSRESLSMTEHTSESLRKLLSNFYEVHKKNYAEYAAKINRQCIDKAFWTLRPADLLTPVKKIVGLTNSLFGDTLTDYSQISRALLSKSYPADRAFYKQDIELRLRSLIDSGYGNRGKIQSFLADYRSTKRVSVSSKKPTADWFQRRLVVPLLLSMRSESQLSADRLLVYGHNDRGTDRRISYSEVLFHTATKFQKRQHTGYLPFLRNVVLLSCSRKDVTERSALFPEMKHWFGEAIESLVYIVHRSEPKIAAARKFFEAQGYWVVDLTKPYPGEVVVADVDARVREYKPRKIGIPLLSCLVAPGNRRISTIRAKAEDAPRVENPEFVLKCGAKTNQETIGDYPASLSEDIVQLFGDKGGIVVNETQAAKYIALGAEEGDKWIRKAVVEEVKNNPRIHALWANDIERGINGHLSYSQRRTLQLICKDDVLRTHYQIDLTASDKEQAYLRLWKHFRDKYMYADMDDIDEVNKLLKGVPINDNIRSVTQSITKSTLITMLDIDQMTLNLRETGDASSIQMLKAKTRDLLIWALAS